MSRVFFLFNFVSNHHQFLKEEILTILKVLNALQDKYIMVFVDTRTKVREELVEIRYISGQLGIQALDFIHYQVS